MGADDYYQPIVEFLGKFLNQSATSRVGKISQWERSKDVRPVKCLPGPFRRFSARLVAFFWDLTAMAEQQQFYLLLGNLMSADNNVRKQAEVRKGDIFATGER